MSKIKAKEGHKRSLLKAVSWRCLATLTTFIISFIVTGSFAFAASIGGLEVIAKLILYYFHERLWDKASLGKRVEFERQNQSTVGQ